MIGIAFSIGFILGPLLGALFAKQAREMHGEFYTTPAYFALTLAVIDIFFILIFLKETLPQEKRVRSEFYYTLPSPLRKLPFYKISEAHEKLIFI